jgi:serine protease inhibitor
MMHIIKNSSALILILLATNAVWPYPARATNDPQTAALVDGNTAFALDLYSQLASQEGNIFFSPFSISTALAMTLAGAQGQTAEQISEVLHFPIEREQLHRAFDHLGSELNVVQEKAKVQLSVANALWAQEDHHFLDTFLNVARTSYRAQLNYADFKSAYEAARKKINAWVERQTNDKIKDLIKPGVLDALTRLVLVNAIYFKGLWESPFTAEETKDAPFWVTPDASIHVPMMRQEGKFNYTESAELQIIELPYGGEELSMIILLPRKVDGLSQLEMMLGLTNLNGWLASLKSTEVLVIMPRFKVTSEFNLSSTLTSLGMPDAFNVNRADFSGMDGTRELHISAVIHKAFVDVNEEGTEAAAATGVVVGVTSLPLPPPVFQADHPFVFLIRDDRSGSILFLGRLADPAK